MSNFALDQKAIYDNAKAVVNPPTNLQRKSHTSIAEGSILDNLIEFASSVPDFRRTGRGNDRHQLRDILILIILVRMSGCVCRADMIEFGRHNLKKLQSMGLLKNGVPSEPTLCRVENGIDSMVLAGQMAVFSGKFQDEFVHSRGNMEIICIDGKSMRGTIQENGRSPDIVSAYCSSTGITLATEACKEKAMRLRRFHHYWTR